MQADSVRHDKTYYWIYLLWYTLLFAAVTAGVFLVFIVQGRGMVWYSDAVAQYVPRAAYFSAKTREILANMLKGDFYVPLYDFALGMGNAIPLHLEPLYWLYLLFDAWDVELAFNLLAVLRFYLAGLSMSVFLLYFRNGRAETLIGTFAYVYCDYAMWACMRHTLFEIALIMLPLSILCIEEIYRRKRWYLLTLLMMLQMWCGFYFAYMNTIAMGVYFLIRFFSHREGRTWKEFWLRMRTIVCSYTLGVAMGSLALTESLASYLTSSRTEAMEYTSPLRYLTYGKDWPLKFFQYFLTAGRGPGNWLRLGFLPLTYAAVVVLFLRKGRKSLKAAVVTGVVFCMLPAVAFVFSGFGNINNRWSYILAFVMASVLAFVARDLLTLTKKEQWIVAAACLPFLASLVYETLYKSGKHARIALLSAAVLLLTLAVLLFLNRCKRISVNKALFGLICLAVVSHWCYGLEEYLPSMGNVASEYPEYGSIVPSITSTPLAASEEIEDDGFYRVATKRIDRKIQGAAQFYRFYGTVYYSSTVNRVMQEFYDEMALSSWSKVRMKGFNGRAFLDTLACVKYFTLPKDTAYDLPYGYEKYGEAEKDGEVYELFENTMALPVGYTYDNVISREQLAQYESPQRQEALMQAAVLEDDSACGALRGTREIQITGSRVPVTDMECENLTIEDGAIVAGSDKDTKPTLTLYFDDIQGAEVYLYMKGLCLEQGANTSINYRCGKYKDSYGLHGANNIYWTKQKEYIFHMGYQDGTVNSCRITFERKVRIDLEDIGIYCQPMDAMESYVDDLRENALEDVQVLTNGIKGTVALPKEKLLVLSIPWQNGWTAYVDGEKTDLLRANIMYMALPLEAGEHTVELRYRLPGLGLCLGISAAGMVLFIAALVIRRKRKNAA